jgi:hypothetical protein
VRLFSASFFLQLYLDVRMVATREEQGTVTYLSEQYKTVLLGTTICFSQTVLYVKLVRDG